MSESPQSPGSQWLTSALLAGSIACAGFSLIIGAYGSLRLMFEMWRPEQQEAKVTVAVAMLLGAIAVTMYWGYRRRSHKP